MAFCKTIRNKIKALFGQFDSYVQTHVTTALKVTTGIKKALESPFTDILTAIIPTDVDSVIRSKLLIALNHIIPALTIVENCKGCTSLSEKISCFIEKLKKQDPALQEAILHKLASLLTKELDGSKLAQNVYDLFVQAQYSVKK